MYMFLQVFACTNVLCRPSLLLPKFDVINKIYLILYTLHCFDFYYIYINNIYACVDVYKDNIKG